MYYKFDSQEQFDTWHAQVKTLLGIPLPDGITTAYTELRTKPDGELYAWVDAEHANGLTSTTPPEIKQRQ